MPGTDVSPRHPHHTGLRRVFVLRPSMVDFVERGLRTTLRALGGEGAAAVTGEHRAAAAPRAAFSAKASRLCGFAPAHARLAVPHEAAAAIRR